MRFPLPVRPRGFTLIELAMVMATMALLAGLAVPAYTAIAYRARVAEARTVLEAIAHAQLAYHRDHGHYLACAPSGEGPVPAGVKEPFDTTRPGWAELGIAIDGHVRYRYEVVLEGDSFVAIARGDLDADGRTSRIALQGRTFHFVSQDELE